MTYEDEVLAYLKRIEEAYNRMAAKMPNPEPSVPVELAIMLYNSGYKSGHHDTVESVYTDIVPSEMTTYHAEEVTEILAEAKKCNTIKKL